MDDAPTVWVRPTRRLLVALLLLVTGSLPGATARGLQPQRPSQPPAATFRTQVNLVEVDAVIVDSAGRFVPDLDARDFELIEDGKQQALASVEVVNIPVARAVKTAYGSLVQDVRSNTPFDGRVYLIVLDDLHISQPRTNAARTLARGFIERTLAPNDLASVIVTSGTRTGIGTFTGNRRLLLEAIDRFVGRKVVSPALALLGAPSSPDDGNPDKAAMQRVFNARTSLEALARTAALAGTIQKRRKAMILIGEGIDYDLGSMGDTPRELRDRLRELVGVANRANLTLYAFDPRVFSQMGDDMVDIASTPPASTKADVDQLIEANRESVPSIATRTDARGDGTEEVVKSTMVMDDLRAAQENLRTLAVNTGGFAVTGSPSLAGAFDRIRSENSSYYILSYYPAADPRDGRFHNIEVRVRRPGLKIAARKGYLTPRGAAPVAVTGDPTEGVSPELRDALNAALPVTGLTLRAAAVPFKGIGRTASVAVIVQADGRQLLFTPKSDRFEDSMELSFVALDPQGRVAGGEHLTVDMPLSAKMRDFVSGAGVVFQTRLNLTPGSYQLRIAGRDAGSARVGSVLYDLEVPDFQATPLAMTGIVVTGEGAGQVPAPRPDVALRSLLSGTPLAVREFARSDTITALVEIYDAQTETHDLRITSTVNAEDGRQVFKQEDLAPGADVRTTGYGYTVQVPLADLEPGSYALRIEVASASHPDLPQGRQVQFTVK